MVSVAVSTVGMTELIFLNWPYGDGERPVLLRCLAVSTDASSNQACRKTLFIHKTTCCLRRNLSFLCSVISQDKVVALDRWGGKWNHLSMTPRLTTDCAKNYCNRTLIVKVIVENVVTCFLGTWCSFVRLVENAGCWWSLLSCHQHVARITYTVLVETLNHALSIYLTSMSLPSFTEIHLELCVIITQRETKTNPLE